MFGYVWADFWADFWEHGRVLGQFKNILAMFGAIWVSMNQVWANFGEYWLVLGQFHHI